MYYTSKLTQTSKSIVSMKKRSNAKLALAECRGTFWFHCIATLRHADNHLPLSSSANIIYLRSLFVPPNSDEFLEVSQKSNRVWLFFVRTKLRCGVTEKYFLIDTTMGGFD